MSSSKDVVNSCVKHIGAMLKMCQIWILAKFESISKSLIEVMVTVCFTFVPFFILSIAWKRVEQNDDAGSFFHKFWSYWQAGEIVLPILGLCGAVTALLALNKGYFSWWVHALVAIAILVVALGGGAALIGSDGFNEDLNVEVIKWGFVCYGILALVWFFLVATVRVTEPGVRKSENAAQKILNEARVRRGQARDRP